MVVIEAEDLALTGDWKVVDDRAASGGRYITWEGLSPSANNNRPDDVVTTMIEIDRPGSYRFTWAMRQPAGVDSDKANDSWLDFPDAARFGPVGGGDYPGFIKVFGNAKGDFAYRARADVNHQKSTISVEFERAGRYTLQIAGRSHGHQIDRIVVHHSSISQADAIAGRSGGCDDDPPTTTTTRPTSTTAPPTTGGPDPRNCSPNTSGRADLGRDLISLHYDHAPDRDDGHATVAGKEVAIRRGFTPWVIGGPMEPTTPAPTVRSPSGSWTRPGARTDGSTPTPTGTGPSSGPQIGGRRPWRRAATCGSPRGVSRT